MVDRSWHLGRKVFDSPTKEDYCQFTHLTRVTSAESILKETLRKETESILPSINNQLKNRALVKLSQATSGGIKTEDLIP